MVMVHVDLVTFCCSYRSKDGLPKLGLHAVDKAIAQKLSSAANRLAFAHFWLAEVDPEITADSGGTNELNFHGQYKVRVRRDGVEEVKKVSGFVVVVGVIVLLWARQLLLHLWVPQSRTPSIEIEIEIESKSFIVYR